MSFSFGRSCGLHAARMVVTLILLCTGCSSDGDSAVAQVRGRVYLADTNQALERVVLVMPDGRKTQSGVDGTFSASYARSNNVHIAASSVGTAPITKRAPMGREGYVDLYLKGLDATQEFDPTEGGAVRTQGGAAVVVRAGQMTKLDGSAPERVILGIATPDTNKSADLASLPGNFDARVSGRLGKLSAEAPAYVSASDGTEALTLRGEERITVQLPVRALKVAKAALKLYRYDFDAALWVEAGDVSTASNADGVSVYSAETDQLGWLAVGEFYDQLTCVRGCVQRQDASPADSARVVVTGLEYVAELTTFAGVDGCWALDVRADANVAVTAVDEGVVAGPVPLRAAATLATAANDPSLCQQGPLLTLTAAASGFECGDGQARCDLDCVDLTVSTEHCGACGADCAGTCRAGVCDRTAPQTPCLPGHLRTAEGTCASCSAGTFSASEDATACTAWSRCEPGTYVAEVGSSTRNRVCAACANGTYSATADASHCVPARACAAGSREVAAATATSLPECEPCAADAYCEGGSAPLVTCGVGSWDHDQNSASPCLAFTRCLAGSYVSTLGSPASDQVCSPCVAGSFSASDNALVCTPYTPCLADSYITATGTASTDQSCATCAAGSFSTRSNAPSCSAWAACDAGQYVLAAPSDTRDRPCAACAAGSYSTSSNATSCTPHTQCADLATPGTPTSDAVCAGAPTPQGSSETERVRSP